jgi:hypothetical protein
MSVEESKASTQNSMGSSEALNSSGGPNIMQTSSLDSSENSGDEFSSKKQVDDEYFKKQEKQYQFILDLLQKELEVKEKEKERKAAVKALFKDDADRAAFGIQDKTIKFMTKHIKSYKKELRIKDGQLKKDSDYVKVDDTWVQLSKLMLYPFRVQFLKERM